MSSRGTGPICLALVLGACSGLLEGAIHMGLQRFVLENVWYQIIWIAAVVNALLLAGGAAVLVAVRAFGPMGTRRRACATFLIVLGAVFPCLALLLRPWTHPVAVVILTCGASAAATRAVLARGERVFEWCRRAWPAAIGLVASAFVAIEGGFALREYVQTRALPAAPQGSPHVLLLIVDTLRADHLSSYGYPKATSATMDRLASEGVLFERAFSPSSYTLPAHVSMLTGLDVPHHGAEWLASRAWSAAGHQILPEVLRNAGYRTGAFSGNTVWVTREHGFGRGFLHFEDFFHSPADRVLRTAYGRVAARLYPVLGWKDLPARKRASDTNRALVEWVERDRDRPVFAMVNYFDAHDPYLPPARFSGTGEPAGLIDSWHGAPPPLTREELLGEIDSYDGAVRYVDEQIGDLMQRLSMHTDRDLLVIVTSDHGEEFGEHGGYGHGNHLYREVVHVPLIVWRPGRIPGGVRVATPVTTASIPATVARLIGLDAAFAGAAPSLQPLWASQAPVVWPAARSDLAHRPWDRNGGRSQSGAMRSLATSTWHFIHHSAFGPELYDVVSDPAEQRNLGHEPAWQGLVQELMGELDRANGARAPGGYAR